MASEFATGALVGVDALIARLVADRQQGGDLLGTVLQAKPGLGRFPDRWLDSPGIAAVGGARLAQALGLVGPVAAQPAVASQLAADGGRMAVEQLGDLALFMAGFDEDVNVVSCSGLGVCRSLGNFDLAVDGAKCSRILTHLPVNQNCTSNLNSRNKIKNRAWPL
jgi:hypothetical protein